MPFKPIVLVSTFLHAWIAWRIAPALTALPGWPISGVLLVGLLLVSAVLIPWAFRLGRRHDKSRLEISALWLGLVLMGLFSTLFVLTLMRDALLVLAWLAVLAGIDRISLDALQSYSAAAVPLLALLATAGGFWSARRTARVVRVDVPIEGLPPALQGFTLAQISDIHLGPTVKSPYLRRIVDRVNGLQADLVAITGDLVDGSVAELAPHATPLADLRSRHGTFFVTGNHEYYSGAGPWIAELRRLGLHVLVNQHVVLCHPASTSEMAGAEMVLAGVADFTAHHFIEAHRSDPDAALRGAPERIRTRVLLAHQPLSATAAAQAGFQLQLSGHTHGGQIWPWNHFVRFQQPFTAGLNRLNRMWVYTNSGTGYWGPPIRFGVPSEITLLRLVAA